MRIAHISDLHFFDISFHPSQLFSRRWAGNLNFLLYRKKYFSPKQPYAFIEICKKEGVSHLLISGDLTTTSLKEEYLEASLFIETVKREGIAVFVIPGNHDHYTKRAYIKKSFYSYFPASFERPYKKGVEQFDLATQGVTATSLESPFWLIGMDTTMDNPLFAANGCFSSAIESALRKLLHLIPPTDPILLMNHFPLFRHEAAHRQLLRAEELQKLVKEYPNILFYLHGHTHRSALADLRANSLPIIVDSGSVSYAQGSWNLLDLSENRYQITLYRWLEEKWKKVNDRTFSPRN